MLCNNFGQRSWVMENKVHGFSYFNNKQTGKETEKRILLLVNSSKEDDKDQYKCITPTILLGMESRVNNTNTSCIISFELGKKNSIYTIHHIVARLGQAFDFDMPFNVH